MITGTTRVFGILADPVAHVRTPEVMNEHFAARGIDAVLVPWHVTPGDLPRALDGARVLRNLGGLIVTVPHKTSVVPLCESAGEQARLVGAANAIRRGPDGGLTCEMFDGIGFLNGLIAEGRDPKGQRVLLLGAGGAAAAIAFALAGHGVAALTVANRTAEKAEALAARVQAAVPDCVVAAGPADPDGYDLVVNGTSLGLKPDDPLPLDPERLAPATLVAEVVMKPERTPLLEAAAARGCPVHLGRHMLTSQVRLLADFVTAEAPSPARTG
jgi:shikimate dehydrogenase